ncbi:hypothetical protein CspeluHIS016_0205020 [Cutaneotrichosporon spelunceum]|uniref:Uncharacterized protein n=1 Tax=Cutaneotrichosporon spelunceum TaxID=1672016 RepID=A0AAD3YA06_9TREE|nr:hypothetical protein CspeluHIS016_0205020 [Cutaneotrichosporon spelunceum]
MWHAIVDRVHYHFHFVYLQLQDGDCRRFVLKPSEEAYVLARCRHHRGFYDGFCPFVGQRYASDDARMNVRQVATRLFADAAPQLCEKKEEDEKDRKENENRRSSLILPRCSSPEPEYPDMSKIMRQASLAITEASACSPMIERCDR